MKSIVKIVGLILFMAFPFIANAQSLYEESGKLDWKKQVRRGNITYNIKGTPFIIYVENSQNQLLHQRNYKVDSNPRRYYSEADGMCEMAEINENTMLEIERTVFSDLEIDDYTENPGYIMMDLAVNPGTGRVEEVIFTFWYIDNAENVSRLNNLDFDSVNRHILNVPIDKLGSLEQLLKERMICNISQKLQEQMPLYAPASIFLFYKSR